MNPSIHPVWFPFTQISPVSAGILQAVFSTLTVFQTSSFLRPELKKMADNPLIRMYAPFPDDSTGLETRVLDSKKWMQSHSDHDAAFLKAQFFSDRTSESLSSDIRNEIIHYDSPKIQADTLMAARVFLAIAEEFDCQQADFSSDLDRFQEQEKQFLNQFSSDGETPDFEPGSYPIVADRPEDHMLEQRLSAWSTLFLHDGKKKGGHEFDLFVTDSVLTLENILEKVSDAACIAEQIALPGPDASGMDTNAWQQAFVDILAGLITGSEATPFFPKGSLPVIAPHSGDHLNVSMVSGKTPEQVFGHFVSDRHMKGTEDLEGTASVPNTLIVSLVRSP
ncbi:MAG TPA: hypothetical protein VLP30_05130 [Desulfatirhabdiaceae bacterium]|nr:hypothetical protein [Desulfatirhabdiaceae bacterium]